MIEKLFSFLKTIYPNDKVALSYSDRITEPGLSVIFYEDTIDRNRFKDLEGTTNIQVGTYVVQIWNDSLKDTIDSSQLLIDAAEGTIFQITTVRSAWKDVRKRKWHRDITIEIMEDV